MEKKLGTTPHTLHQDKFQKDRKCMERRERKREKERRIQLLEKKMSEFL